MWTVGRSPCWRLYAHCLHVVEYDVPADHSSKDYIQILYTLRGSLDVEIGSYHFIPRGSRGCISIRLCNIPCGSTLHFVYVQSGMSIQHFYQKLTKLFRYQSDFTQSCREWLQRDHSIFSQWDCPVWTLSIQSSTWGRKYSWIRVFGSAIDTSQTNWSI